MPAGQPDLGRLCYLQPQIQCLLVVAGVRGDGEARMELPVSPCMRSPQFVPVLYGKHRNQTWMLSLHA